MKSTDIEVGKILCRQGEVASKKVVDFEIPEVPRCKRLDEIVKMLMDGATLPKMVKVKLPQMLDFSVSELAQAIQDLTWWVETGQDFQNLRDMTGMTFSRCEEILEIRNKLLDILE